MMTATRREKALRGLKKSRQDKPWLGRWSKQLQLQKFRARIAMIPVTRGVCRLGWLATRHLMRLRKGCDLEVGGITTWRARVIGQSRG